MRNNHYILEENQETKVLYLSYYFVENQKLTYTLWGFFCYIVVMGILIYIMGELNSLICKLLHMDVVSGLAITFVRGVALLLAFFCMKLLIPLAEYVWTFYRRRTNPKLYCLVQDNKIIQGNDNSKFSDIDLTFSLSSEDIQEIKIDVPEKTEKYYQIRLKTEKRIYRLNMCFNEQELDELRRIIIKIKK